MDLQQYIKDNYDSRHDWFVEEVNSVDNQTRISKIMGLKEYLSGKHKIGQLQSYEYNGQVFSPKKVTLQYAKTLINFQKSYLLNKPVTLTGDENVVAEFQKVSRQGKYDRFNLKVIDKLLKYGMVGEYVYLENGKIKSKLIDGVECFPVYDYNGTLLAVIEAFVNDGISYYTVYEEDVVKLYDNDGGELRQKEQYNNLSGLPIIYKTENEIVNTEGRSELEDWINIIDDMEEILSKYTDAFYKYMTPIPVMTGQQLKGDGIPSHVIGGGLNLDDGAEFKLVSNGLDNKTFESVYKTLLQSLLDVSQTPAVSMSKTDISNLSEVSIKLLFQLANIKASINEEYIREGLEQRFDTIKYLLEEYKGMTISEEEYDSLDINFHYATPSNDREVIENLKVLREQGGISLESLLENSPFTSDVRTELLRIGNDNSSGVVPDGEIETKVVV
ncbi:phage portal protein [Bacillus massiliigorillae]|uniref:phage portal protein n=1 Tax=Bacillus massiliigorillae TaxID=1243664 RepID=UPI0003A6D1DC|nr:phage portal protein [Bacillus massiliigorillae]